MIGVNDVQSEVFRISDARKVHEFFKKTPWMVYVGFWSINRDKPGVNTGANPFDSGILQNPWDFTNTFQGKLVQDLEPSPRPDPPYISPPLGNPIPLSSDPFASDPFSSVEPIQISNIVPVTVAGKVTAIITPNKLRIRYTRPNGGISNIMAVQIKHNCNIGDPILVTLKGTKPHAFVQFEKIYVEKLCKGVPRKNAAIFWNDVVAEFLEKCKTEDVDTVMYNLQNIYVGLGPENQQRLKKMLS
jgi:hypothetical protein